MKRFSLFCVTILLFVFHSNVSFARHGFAWSDKASFSGTRNLTGIYNYNSSGSSIKVTYKSTGSYFVEFEDLGSSLSARGGHVQVTSYGSNNAFCKVEGWSRFKEMKVSVDCYNALGNKVDSQFTISVRNPENPETSFAYVYVDEPNDDSSVGEEKYTKNPGGSVTITRSSEGQYKTIFSGLASFLDEGGHVQVTSEGNNSDTCQVKSWHKVGSDVHVYVNCYTVEGAYKDTPFFLNMTTQAVHGDDGFKAAYAWGSNPSSAEYSANSFYCKPSATIKRTSQGKYSVIFNDIVGFGKSNVQVGSYSSDFKHCKVNHWSQSGTKVTTNLFCFDKNGLYSDSKFVVRLVHK